MNKHSDNSFGINFERVSIGLIAVWTGIILIYLAVMGPLLSGAIKYRTAENINNQLIGQDLVNMVVLAPY